MMLPNGKYTTAAGSILEVSGKHSGQFTVDFDRYGAEKLCDYCMIEPTPDHDGGKWWLTWYCERCGGGRAELKEVEI